MDISECREKLSSLETTLDMVRQAERNIMTAIRLLREEERITERQGRVCGFCGSSDYYAKGLCKACYWRARQHGGDPAYRIKPKKEPPPPPTPYDWRISLRNDVLGADAGNVIAPTDIEASVDYALSTLRDRERYVVLMRYRDRATLGEIGVKYGFTAERARQLVVRALRMLRRPITRQYLLIGVESAKRLEEEKAEAAKRLEQEKAEAAKQEYEAREDEKRKAIACANVGIDCLDTTVRAFNALARDYWGKNKGTYSGIPTIAHYLNLRYRLGEAQFYEYLMSMRQMGRKSAENVIACLDNWVKEHGYQKEEGGA